MLIANEKFKLYLLEAWARDSQRADRIAEQDGISATRKLHRPANWIATPADEDRHSFATSCQVAGKQISVAVLSATRVSPAGESSPTLSTTDYVSADSFYHRLASSL